MAISLTFDADACVRALVKHLIKVADILIKEFYNDATSRLSAEGKLDTTLALATYDYGKEIIEARCKFHTQAILESFGTGSLSDKSAESYWAEYTQDSTTFNSARDKSSGAIVGRSKGTYVDVWGHTRGSSGKYAGRPLENAKDDGTGIKLIDYNTGELREVKPTAPTYSIQRAEDWIIRDTETKVERRIKMEVEKFLSTEASKFFVEVGV